MYFPEYMKEAADCTAHELLKIEHDYVQLLAQQEQVLTEAHQAYERALKAKAGTKRTLKELREYIGIRLRGY